MNLQNAALDLRSWYRHGCHLDPQVTPIISSANDRLFQALQGHIGENSCLVDSSKFSTYLLLLNNEVASVDLRTVFCARPVGATRRSWATPKSDPDSIGGKMITRSAWSVYRELAVNLPPWYRLDRPWGASIRLPDKEVDLAIRAEEIRSQLGISVGSSVIQGGHNHAIAGNPNRLRPSDPKSSVRRPDHSRSSPALTAVDRLAERAIDWFAPSTVHVDSSDVNVERS